MKLLTLANVAQLHPGYIVLHYLELHLTAAVRLEEQALEASLEQLPVLYQL